MEAAS